ncbi:MAG: RiPP maturation radical SAM C-methyltransferase [Leptospirales bacterium]
MVHLVVPPYGPPEHPALGVSVIKAALTRSGISSSVNYLNLLHAQNIGLPRNMYVGTLATILLGEWTFARAAFPDATHDDEGYFALALKMLHSRWSHIEVGAAINMLLEDNDLSRAAVEIREASEQLIETSAAEIVAQQPKIVGCSSVFQQHCASLALLRRVRELDPDIVTVIGGSNCEGPMGLANIRNFSWLDFVVSGEADLSFPELCINILEDGRNLHSSKIPDGVYAQMETGGAPVPPSRGLVTDLDLTPIPDMSDYFEQLAQLDIKHYIDPSLLVETSRGCWWGDRSHCKFCGLNGVGMVYRSKSPDRVIKEFEQLAKQHSLQCFAVVDNILDMKFFDTVLPDLAARPEPYTIFYETKANLTREQVRKLKAAGIHSIQPGIESLHNEPISKMGKGSRVSTNLQLLKWAREFGINVIWIILSGLPEDQDHWYQEMADMASLLGHLCPPAGVGNIEWHRFSPYFERASDFGLELEPLRLGRYIYPVTPDQLSDLSYSFETLGKELSPRPDPLKPGKELLDLNIRLWQKEWKEGARLEMSEVEGGICIEDTRKCATTPVHKLAGLDAAIYRVCDTAQAKNVLLRQLSIETEKQWEWDKEVLPRLSNLIKHKTLIKTGSKYLALAHRKPERATSSSPVHGSVDLNAYFADRQADIPLTKLFKI